ncbi:MAG: hypothetical protein M0R23_06305 [Bacteroidales bacterium]|nr:hypothetical protein [Bacteroidales bacterium]
MEAPFSYNKIYSGINFISRKKDIILISDCLKAKKSITLYSAPKTGKQSLIQQSLNILNKEEYNYILCQIDLFNVRNKKQFISAFGNEMLSLSRRLNIGSILPFDIQIEKLSENEIINLPEKIAEKHNKNVIIYFKEFQNILLFEDGEEFIETLENIWTRQHETTYIFTGSFINSMKYIFEEKKYFFNHIENIIPSKLSQDAVVEYIISGFLSTGRVIEQEQALEIYNITDGNPWYINHLCSICYSLPIGYVNSNIVNKVKEILLSIHVPNFMQIVENLTENQLNFLKAVLDEVPRFSSSEILEKYKLNSSANVFRLKDALKKKEVITFDKDDNAQIIDPMFKYWLKNYYFKTNK